MLFLRTVVTTALVLAGTASALPLTVDAVQERQLSALAGLLPELGPILDSLLGDILRRDEAALDRRQLGGGLGSLTSLTSLLGGLGGSGANGEAGTTGTGQVAGGGIAGESGNARAGKSPAPGSGLTARQLGGGGLGSLSSLTSLLGGLGGSGADGAAGQTGAGQVAGGGIAGESGNARVPAPGSGFTARQIGGIGGGGGGGGLGSLLGPLGGILGGGGLGARDMGIEPRQVSTNGAPGLDGLLGGLGPLLGGGLGGGLRRDDNTLDRRQLDAVTGLLSSLEPLLKGLGL